MVHCYQNNIFAWVV